MEEIKTFKLDLIGIFLMIALLIQFYDYAFNNYWSYSIFATCISILLLYLEEQKIGGPE